MIPSNSITVHTPAGRHDIRAVLDGDEANMLFTHVNSPQPREATHNVAGLARDSLAAGITTTLGAATATAFGNMAYQMVQSGTTSAWTLVVGAAAAVGGVLVAYGVRDFRAIQPKIDKLATLGVEPSADSVGWLQRMSPAIAVINDRLSAVRNGCYLVPLAIAGGIATGHPELGLLVACAPGAVALKAGNDARRTLSETRSALATGMAQEEGYAAARRDAAIAAP